MSNSPGQTPVSRVPKSCALCRGSGEQADNPGQACEACDGRGEVMVAEPTLYCQACFGMGKRNGICPMCRGTGWRNAQT